MYQLSSNNKVIIPSHVMLHFKKKCFVIISDADAFSEFIKFKFVLNQLTLPPLFFFSFLFFKIIN